MDVRVKPTHYSCQILLKLGFSLQVSGKIRTLDFNENPSGGAELIHAEGRAADGQRNRRDEMKNIFSQCCERAYKTPVLCKN
jgi:hypothetical protein